MDTLKVPLRRLRLPPGAWACLLCLAAFGLRLAPMWVNRFHSDEALYASWALAIISGRDPLLAAAAPDKPPLLFYAMAPSFLALGRVEVAARLPGLAAGVVSVALMWRLGSLAPGPDRWVYARTASLALALSPFAILFSPTAFLDPLMVMFALAALLAAARARPGSAGIFLGLAGATKVQGLVLAPLVLAWGLLAVVARRSAGHSPKALALLAVRFLSGLALPAAVVLIWDRLRSGVPFWVQQTVNYGGIRPIYAGEVMPRLAGWAGLLPYFLGVPLLIVLGLGLPLLLLYDLTRGARTSAAALDLALIAFGIGYFFLHWLLAFPVWDRYMLGLVPVVCLLVGRLASLLATELFRRWPGSRWPALVVMAVLVALLAWPAAQAASSGLPVGGDHGPHDGLDQVTAPLRDLPYGTVVYDHWLGWALRYYLTDSRVYIAYFATPQALAEDLHVFGRTSARYMVLPASESSLRIERAIAVEGFTLSPVLATRDRHGRPTFTLYRILPNQPLPSSAASQ